MELAIIAVMTGLVARARERARRIGLSAPVRWAGRVAVLGGTGAAGAATAGWSAGRAAAVRRWNAPARKARRVAWSKTRPGRVSVWTWRRLVTVGTWLGDGLAAAGRGAQATPAGWRAGVTRGRGWLNRRADPPVGRHADDRPPDVDEPTVELRPVPDEPERVHDSRTDDETSTTPGPDAPGGVNLTKGPDMAHTEDDASTVEGVLATLKRYAELFGESAEVQGELTALSELADQVEGFETHAGAEAKTAIGDVSEAASALAKALSDLSEALEAAVKATEAGIGDS